KRRLRKRGTKRNRSLSSTFFRSVGMKIELLGTSFTIQTDEDPAYLERVVDYYRKKVFEIQSGVRNADALKVAILSGMLAVDELFKEQNRSALETPSVSDANTEREAEEITARLLASLDSVLENPE
ncbi:MAG: cell division protein ZapA, partial [Spirochaetaceae bacterium]